jgi:ppGpp synthetase/RelA/SpoT-type nucleotidyltranferase
MKRKPSAQARALDGFGTRHTQGATVSSAVESVQLGGPESLWVVSDFPSFDYSMKDVLRAGEALAGVVPWNNDEEATRALHVFRVAHNWRDSHAYPMRKVRYELAAQLKAQGVRTSPVARLKRMPSIRRKLANIPGDLNQMNDLAGCRAILSSMSDVRAFIERMRQNSTHNLFREYPYIDQAKPDGYRSHHMVFKFCGRGNEEVYNGRRIEVQIRTQLQHSWATTVEAVGLFRREDMKAGKGNADWLRLFTLMSAEFAQEESSAADLPDVHGKRIDEIVELESKLDAVDVLQRLNQAFSYSESYVFNPLEKPDYFQIEYDRDAKKVSIRPYFGSIYATQSYEAAEMKNAESGSGEKKIVLVEVDEIENLRRAYPNYFGDVQSFKSRLQNLSHQDMPDYSIPPQQTALQRAREKPDYSWLHKFRRWK